MVNQKLKSLSMQILQNSKMKKLDAYSIFRILTSKKSRYSVNINDFDLDKAVNYDDLKDFIVKVNPYFDFNSQDKLEYYRNYYVISHNIFEFCVLLIEESEKPAYFKIKDTDKNKFLTFNEINDPDNSDKINHAKYETLDETRNRLQTYLKLYEYLKIDKNIQIQIFNSQDQIIAIE